MKIFSILFLISSIGISLAEPADAVAQPPVVDISKSTVTVNTSFVGTNIMIFGAIGGAEDLVIELLGPLESVLVRRKARISGIWVNTENVNFQNVPSYYALAATRTMSEIAPESEFRDQNINAKHLPFSLSNPKELPPNQRLSDYKDALIRGKKDAGLFLTQPLKIHVKEQRLFKVEFPLPNNMATGIYTVKISSFKNRQPVTATSMQLTVKKIGFGAQIFQFAQNQSALYGILAILIAVTSGWIAAIIFRKI
ncbi:MAG: hypothetical protein CMM58_10655 [Rhodospirillaceae bacterium]|nr:hypothetical protein [Rhodospirillaceae bacterium]|tara:strand:+ start:1360 stop:2118 length:759 start_codon:yes stop_codon:yes gene_type:complete